MKKELIRIHFKQKHLKAELRALSFKEGDCFIVYFPSLKISGYGDTIEEAHKLAKISLDDFSENLFKLNSEAKILEVLREYGWEKEKFFDKRLKNLSTTTYEDIKREFNIPDDTKIEEKTVLV